IPLSQQSNGIIQREIHRSVDRNVMVVVGLQQFFRTRYELARDLLEPTALLLSVGARMRYGRIDENIDFAFEDVECGRALLTLPANDVTFFEAAADCRAGVFLE